MANNSAQLDLQAAALAAMNTNAKKNATTTNTNKTNTATSNLNSAQQQLAADALKAMDANAKLKAGAGSPTMAELYPNGISGSGSSGSGSTSTASSSVNNEALKNILRQSYQNSLDYGQQQYENTLNAANDAYNSSARNVNAASDKALKEAYIQKMIAQRDMPQQLAALGLSGGASETMNARMNNNYANNRASIESDRLSALTELLDALNQQKYTAANNLAAQKAESLQDYYNQLISMAANGQDVSGMDASYTPTTTTQTKTTYADDADFQKQYAAVVSGRTSRQTLINNAAELMNYYGYDGFNTLLNASK